MSSVSHHTDVSHLSPPTSPLKGRLSSSLQHPFAASSNPDWHPPVYEKKAERLGNTTAKLVADLHTKKIRQDGSEMISIVLAPHVARTSEQVEADVWSNASSRVIDNGHGLISLENQNLTVIPHSFIHDLRKFYTTPKTNNSFKSTLADSPKRSFVRLNTAPVSSGSCSRLFTRTVSAADASFGVDGEKLQIFLASNKLTVIPLTFFTLCNLSVLSIRNNGIKHLPPEIFQLSSLKSLNIASNRIKYLPSEMLKMSLQNLYVFPNPFLEPVTNTPPPHSSSNCHCYSLKNQEAKRNHLSETVTDEQLPTVLTLVENSLRILFSSSHANCKHNETVLQKYYSLPVDEAPEKFPCHIRKVLKTCIPQSISGEDEFGYSTPDGMYGSWWSKVTGVGVCPSPRHDVPPVFIRHAEVRYSWEKKVGNVNIGGLVPLQWRGCQRGCLDFLAVDVYDQRNLKQHDVRCDNQRLSRQKSGENVVKVIQITGSLDEFDA